MSDSSHLVNVIQNTCHPLHRSRSDFDPLIDRCHNARLVLIGEASHGTHEFYDLRARLTRQLIESHGFSAVIVEADWPDAYRVNRYVRGGSDDMDSDSALGGFRRFPQWMWRNEVVADFVAWLRRHNDSVNPPDRCGFYGMDLYSLYSSMEAVLNYLDRVDPSAAHRARSRYACFESFQTDPQAYGWAAAYDFGKTCEDQVVAQLVDLQAHAAELAQRDGVAAEDEAFYAEQNARLAKNAEEYYRQMFTGEKDTWNLRDTHMTDTIEALLHHLERTRQWPIKAVVWAHNSHLGDARATEMSRQGEVNVGQLCRERFGDAVYSIGFTTHTGRVSAASDWGDDVQDKTVQPSLPGSFERLFHQVGEPVFLLDFATMPQVTRLLHEQRLQRAIGVVYRPETERQSHYFYTRLPEQFDAVIHVDSTTAVRPLERSARLEMQKAETFPTGI